MGNLGLRYPPASTVDRDAHAARVALLAEDCADIDPVWLDAAARQWAKREPFMPRACELRAEADMLRSAAQPRQALPPPPAFDPPPPRETPPLTDEEIRKLTPALLRMGIGCGAIDPDYAASIRNETSV